MTSTPDARLVEAHDLARAALAEITPSATIGDPVGYALEDDGVVSLRFANRLAGYPGWFWTVSVAAVDAETQPTVLETELLPGDGALVAPDWVPWATRLADYHAAQAALAAASDDAVGEAGLDLDLDLDLDDADDLDDDDLDETDLDEDASPRLHAGDLDGVDIDELDPDDGDIGDDDAVDDEDLEHAGDDIPGEADDERSGDGDQPSA